MHTKVVERADGSGVPRTQDFEVSTAVKRVLKGDACPHAHEPGSRRDFKPQSNEAGAGHQALD
jgi:hypothetical protein